MMANRTKDRARRPKHRLCPIKGREMPMCRLLISLGLVSSALLGTPATSSAQYAVSQYPWCWEYKGGGPDLAKLLCDLGAVPSRSVLPWRILHPEPLLSCAACRPGARSSAQLTLSGRLAIKGASIRSSCGRATTAASLFRLAAGETNGSETPRVLKTGRS
jgi:hypothetical protein